MTDRKLVPVDLGTNGMIAVCAFRYCCGRRTYVVSEFVEWAMRNWTSIDEKARKIIQRDLSEEITRDDEARKNKANGAWLPLGDDCDRKEWVSLMAFIYRKEKQEQNNE